MSACLRGGRNTMRQNDLYHPLLGNGMLTAITHGRPYYTLCFATSSPVYQHVVNILQVDPFKSTLPTLALPCLIKSLLI